MLLSDHFCSGVHMKGIRKNSWDFVLNCVRDTKLTWLRIWAPEIYMTHIHVLWDCLHSVHPPVMSSSLMYVFLAGVSYLIRARCTLSFFFFLSPPHAVSVSLGLLIETCPQSVWRHSMPSGWFICSVTHRSSCCETPFHSASIWGILEWMWCISSDIDSVKQFSSFSLLAAELSLAEMTLCSSLTAPLCVCLVLCNGLIGCHGHWLTRQASSELVIPSIFLPTARVINI